MSEKEAFKWSGMLGSLVAFYNAPHHTTTTAGVNGHETHASHCGVGRGEFSSPGDGYG